MTRYLKIIILTACLIQPAHSAIVFSFDIETDQFMSNSGGVVSGDTLDISFLDTTDLYNISVTDIYSWKYNLSVGNTGTSYFSNADTTYSNDIGDQISYDGTSLIMSFTYGHQLDWNNIYSIDDLGNVSGIGTNWMDNLYMGYTDDVGVQHAAVSQFPNIGAQLVGAQILEGDGGDGGDSGDSGDSGGGDDTATVPEPSILALFAAGLFGIGFARRRQA